MCLIKIRPKILFSKVPQPKKPAKKKIRVKRVSKKPPFKLTLVNQLHKKQKKIFKNLVCGLFNLNKNIFVKTTPIKYKAYWALYNQFEETYYSFKNNFLGNFPGFFFKSQTPNNRFDIVVSNIVKFKKLNSDFLPPEDEHLKYIKAYINVNNFDKKKFLKRNFSTLKKNKIANKWFQNSRAFKNKLILSTQRRVLCAFFGFNLKRQRRITPRISNFLKWKTKTIVNFFELMLINVLLDSKLVLDVNICVWFIKNGLVYVNGSICANTIFICKKNDLIQICFSKIYSFFYETHFSKLFIKSKKITNKFSKKILENPEWGVDFYLEKNPKSKKFFKRIFNIKRTLPNYLETDFLTFSVYIVHIPFNVLHTPNPENKNYNQYLARFYNWKFRS